MSLRDITTRIHDDAVAAAARVQDEAEASLASLRRDTDAKKEALKKEYAARLERLLVQNEARITADAERIGKQRVEAAKRAVVDAVFEESLQALSALPAKSYEEVLGRAVEKLDVSLEGAVVLTSPERVKETKEVFRKAGHHAVVKERNDIEAGFCIEARGFEIDMTFKTLMRQKRGELEVSVAQQLFS